MLSNLLRFDRHGPSNLALSTWCLIIPKLTCQPFICWEKTPDSTSSLPPRSAKSLSHTVTGVTLLDPPLILRSSLLTTLTFCHMSLSDLPSQPTGLPSWNAMLFCYFMKAIYWALFSYETALAIRSQRLAHQLYCLRTPFVWAKRPFAISQGMTSEHLSAMKQREPLISIELDHLLAVEKSHR